MASHVSKVLAGGSAFALALFAPAAAASAQEGTPVITNTETVNVTLTPSGEVDVARVYDQIAVQGSGDVAFRNPVSTVGLRNLDSFGGFTVEDGSVVEETSVDGQFRQRSVSDFEQDLPVSLTVVYTLDGEEISPEDLVGRSGQVEASFAIENMTGEPQEVTVVGADGVEETSTETIYDPLAGSLSFTLPGNYTDITSETGFVTAGDGRGGTLMTLSITLIPGLTEPITTASYSAQVENAVIPPASMSIIPVVVDANPSATAQKEALAGGADTGKQIAGGAGEIDANLLRLAAGAGDLVNGLILLEEGSAQLSDGLVNTAAPGAQQLAAGSAELATGLNDTAVPGSALLADGAGQLSGGLNELQSNVPSLVSGVNQLADGAAQLEAGLKELKSKVPALTDGVSQLSDGADKLEAGLKQLKSNIPPLLAGVDKLAAGGATLAGGLNALEGGLDARFGPGLNKLANDLTAAAGAGGLADQVVGGINQIKSTCAANGLPNPICEQAAEDVKGVVNAQVRPQVQAAADGANALNNGYKAPLNPTDPSQSGIRATIGALSVGADDLSAGLNQLKSQLGPLAAGVDELTAGAVQLADGLAQLESSVGPLGDGVDQLTAGSVKLADGLAELQAATGPLASGVNQLADGGNQLADGAGELAAGLVTAGDGASQLADGNGQLADGLQTAADGSVQLSSGLETAAGSAPALPEGANRLSEEGTKVLQQAGADAAISFGTRVAVLEASAERTADGGLPFGAPEGALAAAAYRYDLNGADGSGAQTTGQIVAGVAIAGAAAAGAGVMARRRAA
jgi:putative membrane protein